MPVFFFYVDGPGGYFLSGIRSFGLRGRGKREHQAREWHNSQCQSQSRAFNYEAAGQPNGDRWSNGDLLDRGDRLLPARLPVAEECDSNQRGNFFVLHHRTHDEFR